MALNISLKIDNTTLRYQQDTECRVQLNNRSTGPIAVSFPPFDPTLPIVRLLNVQTGEEREYRGTRPHSAIAHDPGLIAAGGTFEVPFNLLGVVPSLRPGMYEMRVVWEYGPNAARAESDDIRINVTGTTPKNLTLVDAVGGSGQFRFGAWVDLARDPGQPAHIVRSSFALMNNGGVADLQPVAPCRASARPVLSAPAAGEALRAHWLAWIEGQTLHCCHADEALGVADVQTSALPAGDVDIVAPLYSAPVTREDVRPGGGMLLCHDGAGSGEFQLQALKLSTKGVSALGTTRVPGPKPVWIVSHARSARQWLATYLQAAGKRLSLSVIPWPGIPAQWQGPLPLADWPGEFIAGNAIVGGDDAIHGAHLMWKLSPDGPRQLTLVSWQVSPGNALAQQLEQPLEWHPGVPVTEGRVGVSDTGRAIAVMRDGDGGWHVYDEQGGVADAPLEFAQTAQPIEPAFLNGDDEPVLICGAVGQGLRIVRFDGSPLPRLQIK